MGILVNFAAATDKATLPGKRVRAILYNVPHDVPNDSQTRYTIDLLRLADTEYEMQDSGGFQILIAEEQSRIITYDSSRPVICNKTRLNLSPWHVVQRAAQVKPYMMTSLDFPIRRISDPQEQEKEFMRKLGFNVLWTKETANLREAYCPDVKLMVPVQAYNIRQLHQFLDLIDGVSYDGLSLPTRKLTIRELALFLVRFYQLGITGVHILGTSQFFIIALAAYAARHFFQWVSLDATSWNVNAQCAIYVNPLDLSLEYLGNVLIPEGILNLCPCPFCRGITFTSIKNMPNTDRTAHLQSHNFWVIEKVTEELYENSSTVYSLEQFLMQRTSKIDQAHELIKTVSIIDRLRDCDIHTVGTLLIQ